ncbi:MAG: GHMP kinase [Bryobacteraceae bacterium]|jgi:D-glycero-alpha-D-manno-heptose-7-phosphate kinase
MRITAKAPCRVDLAGGTLDIWPLYLYHPGAVTVNFAVDRYASCVLEARGDGRIALSSGDLHREETFDSRDALAAAASYRLPLLACVVRFFAPRTGLTLRTHSEAPAGAGIAGSSALIIALASALNRLTGAGYRRERIREIAQNVEAQIIRVPTGCQDYYPALYGGVSAIELRVDGIVRKPIQVDLDDFNQRLVLAYTGVPRDSGINNWEVTKAHIDGERGVRRNFERIAAIARAMRAALERADWAEAGRLLGEEWAHRRKNAPGITTPLIDRLVAATRRAGALGAKVCGAGGGGCVLFLVERGAKGRVEQVIAREGAQVLPVCVAPAGVRVRVRAEPAGPERCARMLS